MSLPPLDMGENSWHKKWSVKEFLKASWPALPILALLFTFGGYYKGIKVTKMTLDEAITFIPLFISFIILLFSSLWLLDTIRNSYKKRKSNLQK